MVRIFVSGTPWYHLNHRIGIEVPQAPGKTIVRIDRPGIGEISPVDGLTRAYYSHIDYGSGGNNECYIWSKMIYHHWQYFKFLRMLPTYQEVEGLIVMDRTDLVSSYEDLSVEIYENSLVTYWSYFTEKMTVVYDDGSSVEIFGYYNNFPFVVANYVPQWKKIMQIEGN